MKLYAENGTPVAASPDNPYFPDPSLVHAVNAALMLRKPLLITGEPGCGKTQLAYSIAADLGLGDPLRFDTKSVSEASHLFYRYDAVAHFRASQIKEKETEATPYLELQALGKAIVLANPATNELVQLMGVPEPSIPKRSVVLIDEIDKAPRDFPNDLLNEMENFSFRIPEWQPSADLRIEKGTEEMRPVVIITSNSEKNLPEAFLRRCVYHDVPFPVAPEENDGHDLLQEIVLSHIQPPEGANWISDLLSFFRYVRKNWGGRLNKLPGTAELIDLTSLLSNYDFGGDLKSAQGKATLESVLGSMLKTKEDRKHGPAMVQGWVDSLARK